MTAGSREKMTKTTKNLTYGSPSASYVGISRTRDEHEHEEDWKPPTNVLTKCYFFADASLTIFTYFAGFLLKLVLQLLQQRYTSVPL